ncbi:hypothetical protein [Onishia niordana]|uniref:hypothetical protein n=1 Tax=Onishia niordana TaxID=2508711 RepID=UPI0010A075B0|nr:hypothetical protein [Halomonas niordiana]
MSAAIERLYYAPLDGDERDRWRTRLEVRRHEWRRLSLSIRRRCLGGAGRLARWRQTWHLGD